MKDQLNELLVALGWIDLGPQKNEYMISFRNDEHGARINFYFTVKTMTIQFNTGAIKTYKNVTLEGAERIVQTTNFAGLFDKS